MKKKNKGKNQGRKTYDHKHRHSQDKGVFYEFVDANQLIADFWSEVDKILNIYKDAEDQI